MPIKNNCFDVYLVTFFNNCQNCIVNEIYYDSFYGDEYVGDGDMTCMRMGMMLMIVVASTYMMMIIIIMRFIILVFVGIQILYLQLLHISHSSL